MRTTIKLLCLILAAACLFSACGADTAPISTTTATTTTPTTAPTEPPVGPDPNRPLPVLPDKFVTDDPETGDLVLAKDGTANATIVIPSNNDKAASAGADLSSYLTKITGAEFVTLTDDQELPDSNLILVGPTKKTLELGVGPYTGYPNAEKFTVARKGNCLVLCGNDDVSYNGTQYAVTRFLEEAGCGWYAEDELWQIVPEMATLAVKDVEITVTPAISYRLISYVSNTLTSRWYMGGDQVLHGQRIWIYIPKATYAEHPEWFAVVGGQRHDPALTDGISEWQYCYSNQELAAAYAQKMIEYIDEKPNCISVTAAVNDGWYEGWCECAECAALGNKADQALTFANRVAAIVCEKYPDVRISTLAYHDTFLPPEKVKAHENVEVMFCVETNPLDDLMADRQIHEGYNDINKIVYSQSWLANVTEWIENADVKNCSIWGWYCIDDGLYGWKDVPWIQGNVASRNVDVFEHLGVSAVFYDGSYRDDALPMRWPLYVPFAKCMYFSNLTGEEVLYDACQKLYGAAADEMFLFYRLLADSAQASASANGINWVPPAVLDVYCDNYMLLRAAVQAVSAKLDQLTEAQKERVQSQIIGWAHIDMVI